MQSKWFLTAAMLVAATCMAAADWPQFGGPKKNGAAEGEKGLARSWPESGPRELWSHDIGRGYGGPSIRDGRAYLLDRHGNEADVLRCWDLQTGEELWNYRYSAPGRTGHEGSRSTPTVDEKYVFTIGPFGQLNCIDKGTHRPVWGKNLLADYGGKRPHWAVSQSPAVYKDLLIVAPSAPRAGVVALAKATGEEAWRSGPLGKMEYASPLIATIGGVDQVVVVSDGGRISGLDVRNGALLWSYGGWRCRIPIATPLAIGDGRFFLTGGYGAGSAMFNVRSTGGKFRAIELFKIDPPGAIIHNALLHKGHLYVKHNNKRTSRGLMCLDLSGNVKWTRGEAAKFDFGATLLADGLIFSLDGKEGVLRLIEPTPTGYKLLGEAKIFPGQQEIWAPMAISGGRLVLRDQRQIKCLDVRAID